MTRKNACLLLTVLLGLLWPVELLGQRRETRRSSTLPVEQVVSERVGHLESQIVALTHQRFDAMPAEQQLIDLQIDLRVFSRWMLQQVASAEADSDLQATAYLRWMDLTDLSRRVDQWVSSGAASPTERQLSAMHALRQQSYGLKDLATVGELDAQCKQLATHLNNLLSTGSPVQLVTMRPGRVSGPTVQRLDGTGQDRSLAALSNRIRLATISVPLRRTLLSLVAQVEKLSTDPATESEAEDLHRVLEQSLDLVMGLAANTGVLPEARAQLEAQLTEALILYADPRTRSAGQTRLSTMTEYRQLVDRVAQMELSPEMNRQLGPAFVYARENPRSSAQVLGAIERFSQEMRRLETAPRRPLPTPAYQQVARDLDNLIATARDEFLDAASHLGRGGIMGSPPQQLDQLARELTRLMDIHDALWAMPASLETINAYRPRPTGGIERRLWPALQHLTSSDATPQRAQAEQLIREIDALAKLAVDIQSLPVVEISPDMQVGFAANMLPQFQAKCNSSLAELATALASGQSLDESRMNRLRSARRMVEALRDVLPVIRMVEQADVLTRWSDWSLDSRKSMALIRPYRDALSRAFAGFVQDDSAAINEFFQFQRRYEPVVNLLLRVSRYAASCRELPEGLTGELSRLATPSDRAPHATERFVSFATELGMTRAGLTEILPGEVLEAVRTRTARRN